MKRVLLALVLLLGNCTAQGGAQTLSASSETASPSTTASITTTVPATTTSTVVTTTTTPTTTTTSPPVGELLVVGDFGSGGSAEYAVADAMHAWAQTHDVAAILTTGDNLYTSNTDKAWTTPFGWIADAGIPVWVTWGNHDNQRPNAENSTFADPPRWSAHSWGDAVVLSIDATDIGSTEQEQWLEAQLADTSSPVIVAEHYPAFSCSYHGDSTGVRRDWAPLFEQAGVAMVLAGHEHNYQRFEEGGVEYVVSGGGGAGLYALKSCPSGHPARIAGDAVHHFLAISENADGFTVQVVASDGSIIDTFEVAR